ncbi:DUF6157 family protein [Patescibacteria group bacterium]|nr:DUF6157 family protein [Patescibacteria group bacterium]MCL5010226.1 DUF6157 family protein [Patescibacteria group bacterium]
MAQKVHTTNYSNAFIEAAPDSPVHIAEVPPQKGNEKTIASIEYEMIAGNPYKYTSDEVLFRVFAIKNDIAGQNLEKERQKFFSKGQPCFRSSPLTKRYGWGVHSDAEGKIAIFPMESSEYKKLVKDKGLKHLRAMRSKRV